MTASNRSGFGPRSQAIASPVSTRTRGLSSEPPLAARSVLRAISMTAGSSSTCTILEMPGWRSNSRAARPSPPPSTSTDRAPLPSAG